MSNTMVNILFMAPRMVYCSMIYLLWSFLSKRVRRFGPSATDLVSHVLPQISATYNQIIPPKSEATHVTPVREQGP